MYKNDTLYFKIYVTRIIHRKKYILEYLENLTDYDL